MWSRTHLTPEVVRGTMGGMWESLMHQAMEEAALAVVAGDAPFGCVVVDSEGRVVWRDRDRVTSCCDPTAHAEVNAIRGLCSQLRRTKLDGYTFVTTSEPCVTCLSALIRVRARRCVFGARIELDASLPISSSEIAPRAAKHQIGLIGGVLGSQCESQRQALLSTSVSLAA
jgi:tRNA(adenine34) deaminase